MFPIRGVIMASDEVHYDRTALVHAVMECSASIQLVVGPSGIGKSDLLDAAGRGDVDRIVPPPVAPGRSAGALQRGLIHALGEAVALIIEQQSAGERIGRHLSEAAHRLARRTVQDLAKVVGKELLAVVRGRLGESVGEAFIEYLSELKSSYDQRLDQRLATAADPGVVEIFVSFAHEAVNLADGAEIILSLDNGDALDENDLRILGDLVSELPSGLRLRVAFATDRQRQGHLDELLALGAEETRVPPLMESEITAWLAISGLSTAPADRIYRLTGGYPLHLRDMIAHLKAGGAIEEIPLNEQFARRTRAAWNALEAPIAVAARKLAVFTEPLPQERTMDFLGVDLSAWAEFEDRLWRSGVFSGAEPGQRWFHEQRRRYVWESILTDQERSSAAENAVSRMRQWFEVSGRRELDLLAPLARIATDARQLRVDVAGLDSVLALSCDELAVAAALVELSESPPGDIAVFGHTVLSHAREAFPTAGDLIAALKALAGRQMVHISSNQHATAVVPMWGSELAVLVLAGRASAELGRLPIPRAASTFFQLELAPRLGPFNRAIFGVGLPSVAELSHQALDLRRRDDEGTIKIVPPGPDLLIRGKYSERPVYAGVIYESAESRDAAWQALNGLDVEVAGRRLLIKDTIKHPYAAVPSRRFLAAAELLIGQRLLHGSPRLTLAHPPDPETALRRRLAVLRVLRARSGADEERAMGIEEAIGYLLFVSADRTSTLVAEVLGGRDTVQRLLNQPTSSLSDPYARFTLSRDANLLPTERLGAITVAGSASSKDDPVISLLGNLSANAAAYNRHAIPRTIPLNDAALASVLQADQQRIFDDAVAMAAVAQVGDNTRDITPTKTSMILYPDSDPSYTPGYGLVIMHHQPSPSDGPEVNLRIAAPIAGHPSPEQIDDDMNAYFGLERGQQQPVWGWAMAPGVLAEMLGHDRSELRFLRPAA